MSLEDRAVQLAKEAYEHDCDRVSELFEHLDKSIETSFGVWTQLLVSHEKDAINRLRITRAPLLKPLSEAESQTALMLKSVDMILKRKQKGEATAKGSSYSLFDLSKSSVATHNRIIRIMNDAIGTLYHSTENRRNIKCTFQSHFISKSLRFEDFCSISSGFPTFDFPLKSIQEHKQSVGQNCDEEVVLSNPGALCIHPKTHELYVVDNINKRVVVMSPSLELLAVLDSSANSKLNFREPIGIDISLDGSILVVTDKRPNLCWLLDTDGNIIKTISFPEEIHLRDEFAHSACFDTQNNVYVSCATSGVVLKFSPTGDFIQAFGNQIGGAGLIKYQGLIVNEADELLVSAQSCKFIFVFDLGGTLLRKIEINETGSNWTFLTRGPHGGFVLSDCDNSLVSFYNHAGKQEHQICIEYPTGVCFRTEDPCFYVISCHSCTLFRY